MAFQVLRPEDHMLMIEAEIKHRVDTYIHEETSKAVEALTKRIRAEADALAIKLLSYYQIEARADHIFITVKKDK